MADVNLKAQRYGKRKVRLVKVVRHANGRQELAELTATVLLAGDFEASYTEADNKKVVATDSIKNTVYVLAKKSTQVVPIEQFALTIAEHFLRTYDHVAQVWVELEQRPWDRMVINNQAHPHSFTQNKGWRRTTQLVATRKAGSEGTSAPWSVVIESGFHDLCVLKTTGSAFSGFVRDQYTTLSETNDRILCTNVQNSWKLASTDPRVLRMTDFDHLFDTSMAHTTRIFADDNSVSVQATLYRIATATLRDCPAIAEASLALPNIHIFGVDLAPFGLANTGADLDVYKPVSDPSGLISATVQRAKARL
ncbi:hypothetical protein IWQ62_003665 [Dispira parvispora]|uniref:Uricase n=1 Tax=Dispira parvispora TaxID=1520584 RepID=A0A9W8E1F3_9FUNG|nr:hypothetical protein IWQ62_003665 [Dispira parvispora]